MSSFEKYAEILRCPATKEQLHFTENPAEFASYLSKLPEGYQVECGYLNHSNTRFYPVIEGIICMLPFSNEGVDDLVNGVRAFYDDFGWKRTEDGRFHDSALFVEEKNSTESYYLSTIQRLSQFLRPEGRYILDVASGPVFQPENQAFSAHFDKRICVDISIRALKEARRNIGEDKGIFINGDFTNLPLRDEICDNSMSIHTLYHVPKELQGTAVRELIRVTKPGSNIIILYNWAWHSWLMNVLLLPVRVVKAAQRLYRYLTVPAKDRWLSGGLYFYPHTPAWFEDIAKEKGMEVSFHALTSIHQDFVKYYVHDKVGGAALLRFVLRMEEKHSGYLGRHGAFGYVVLRQKATDSQQVAQRSDEVEHFAIP